jgi:hypothetical protein
MIENMELAARDVVDSLWNVAADHERKYPSDIEAVLVFSGPGTYYDRLKPNGAEWGRWMDRDRIRAGVAIVREVTASTMRDIGLVPNMKGHYVAPDNISYHGPFFVYNGIPVENEVIRRALQSDRNKLTLDKAIILDEVVEEDGTTHPNRHTADQYNSLYQAITNPESPLYGIQNVALVAHIPDFVRHPFYAKKLAERLKREHGRDINFYAYGLKSRPGTEEVHMQAEIDRLIPYATKGDLATEPQELII